MVIGFPPGDSFLLAAGADMSVASQRAQRQWAGDAGGLGMMLGHNRKMLGAECMADMLEAYGVTHVFHVPAVLRKTFAVMETRTRIKRLHVHSEATAAYMADGYARASGKPGICMAQVIGALNLAAGLRDAWLAQGKRFGQHTAEFETSSRG